MLNLTRNSKANHFNHSQENKLNFVKTWVGIRKIINITTKASKEINCIQVDNKTINNPTKIANNFNNHFTSITEKIEDNLVKSKFSYSKYLSNSFFITPSIYIKRMITLYVIIIDLPCFSLKSAKLLRNLIIRGFVKSNDHRPTKHQPTDRRLLTHRPTDPLITDSPIQPPKIHQPTEKILFQRLDN